MSDLTGHLGQVGVKDTMSKFQDALDIAAVTPLLDAKEAEAQRLLMAVAKGRDVFAWVVRQLDSAEGELSISEAAAQCRIVLASFDGTLPLQVEEKKGRGPDRAPRRSRKASPGAGPQPAATLNAEELDTLTRALEAYGPLTLAALEEVFATGGKMPLARPLSMGLEDALCTAEIFCSWRPAQVMETGQPDLWGTRAQFGAACDMRFGALKGSAWVEMPDAVAKLMDRMSCGAMAAKWAIDAAKASRDVK